MKKTDGRNNNPVIVLTGFLALSGISARPAFAQDAGVPEIDINMEEVVVLGRLRSAAESLQDERMMEEVVTMYLAPK